jgi:hypothetical protein
MQNRGPLVAVFQAAAIAFQLERTLKGIVQGARQAAVST